MTNFDKVIDFVLTHEGGSTITEGLSHLGGKP